MGQAGQDNKETDGAGLPVFWDFSGKGEILAFIFTSLLKPGDVFLAFIGGTGLRV